MQFQVSKMARRLAVIGLELLFALVVSACRSSQPTPPPASATASPTATQVSPTPSRTPSAAATPGPLLIDVPTAIPNSNRSLTGLFAYIDYDGNLSLQNAKTGEARILLPRDAQTVLINPSFSPNGKEIAYAANAFSKDGQTQGQIRVMGIDRTRNRIVVSASDDTYLDLPAWSPDGKAIYFTALIPEGQTSQRSEIQRVAANGGKPVVVIRNGAGASLSPDGKRIVYQKVDYTTYAASLWVADVNGANAKQLVDDQSFATIASARFAPDSKTIVFGESGPARKKLPGAQADLGRLALNRPSQYDACLFSFLFVCWLERAAAHGLPWDIWLVNLEGTKFERLTDIGADSPVPVWSPDGKFIVFFTSIGIYRLDRATKNITQVSSEGGFGGFDWHAEN